MRLLYTFLVFATFIQGSSSQEDETGIDVFETPFQDFERFRDEEINQGMDTFELSTAIIEMEPENIQTQNDTETSTVQGTKVVQTDLVDALKTTTQEPVTEPLPEEVLGEDPFSTEITKSDGTANEEQSEVLAGSTSPELPKPKEVPVDGENSPVSTESTTTAETATTSEDLDDVVVEASVNNPDKTEEKIETEPTTSEPVSSGTMITVSVTDAVNHDVSTTTAEVSTTEDITKTTEDVSTTKDDPSTTAEDSPVATEDELTTPQLENGDALSTDAEETSTMASDSTNTDTAVTAPMSEIVKEEEEVDKFVDPVTDGFMSAEPVNRTLEHRVLKQKEDEIFNEAHKDPETGLHVDTTEEEPEKPFEPFVAATTSSSVEDENTQSPDEQTTTADEKQTESEPVIPSAKEPENEMVHKIVHEGETSEPSEMIEEEDGRDKTENMEDVETASSQETPTTIVGDAESTEKTENEDMMRTQEAQTTIMGETDSAEDLGMLDIAPTQEAQTFRPIVIQPSENEQMTTEEDFSLTSTTPVSTTAATTTTEDIITETEPPFDQDKLSGLFEPDGSIIDTDLIQSEDETSPPFPRIELPEEESAEILHQNPSQVASWMTTTEASTTSTTTSTTSTTSSEVVVESNVPVFVSSTQKSLQPEQPTIPEMEPEDSTTRSETEEPMSPAIVPHVPGMRPELEEPKAPETSPEVPAMRPETKEPLSPETVPEEPALRPETGVQTPVTIRLTSIDFMPEFADSTSGKFRKLSDQINPDISSIFSSLLGDEFLGFHVENFAKGSVIVNGRLVSRSKVADPEELATRLESEISTSGGKLGGNDVDSRSITIDGVPSRAFVQNVESSYPSEQKSSSFFILAVIVIAVVVVLVVAAIVILMNSRRAAGQVKLKEDGLSGLENGNAYNHPAVNLKSYQHGPAPLSTSESLSDCPVMVGVPCYAPPTRMHF